MFRLFADLIASHIDSTDRLALSEATLLDERQTAELREQFIAVLGHDLRNPLASIDAGTKLLEKTPLNDQAHKVVALMQGSVGRMSSLIGNLLDFARGRMGGGFVIERNADAPLKPVLTQVVELKAGDPDRQIDVHFDFADPVDCDRDRLAQMLSNLLANALTHGAPNKPIVVSADAGAFKLSVTNVGEPIPSAAARKLFQPFTRGKVHANKEELGLGLFIASEIARAHAGMLTVDSSLAARRFTFQMPLR